jgi:hypothetical protein
MSGMESGVSTVKPAALVDAAVFAIGSQNRPVPDTVIGAGSSGKKTFSSAAFVVGSSLWKQLTTTADPMAIAAIPNGSNHFRVFESEFVTGFVLRCLVLTSNKSKITFALLTVIVEKSQHADIDNYQYFGIIFTITATWPGPAGINP